MLILDEPTSGVDPVARDRFWELLIDLSRNQGVTIFVSTHFMNEAERCDRISLMHAGRVLATGAPAAVTGRGARRRDPGGASSAISRRRAGRAAVVAVEPPKPAVARLRLRPRGASESRRPQPAAPAGLHHPRSAGALARSDPARLRAARHRLPDAGLRLRHHHRRRQPVASPSSTATRRPRAAPISRNSRGSRYFVEKPPIADYADLEQALASGDVKAAIEIPPGFGRDIKRGRPDLRSAPGSTAPCRSAPRRSAATCRACISTTSPIPPLAADRATGSPPAANSRPASATTRISTASTPWCRRPSRCCWR